MIIVSKLSTVIINLNLMKKFLLLVNEIFVKLDLFLASITIHWIIHNIMERKERKIIE